METNFKIDGVEFCINNFTKRSKEIYNLLILAKYKVQQLENQYSVLYKARNEYISSLLNEIVLNRSGVDLGLLFSEEKE